MNTYKCLRALIIFLIIVGWIFSGWPQIPFTNFPPRIQDATALQYGIPTGDTLTGLWAEGVPGADGDSALWNEMDETTSDGDTTYIIDNANNTTCEVTISSLTDPGVDTGHEIHVWFRSTGSSGPERLQVALYQDGTAIETSVNLTNRSASYQEQTFALSSTTVANITDYSLLRIRIISSNLAGGETMRVTKVELQIPDAAPALSITSPASAEFPDFQIGTGTTSTCENMGNIDVQGDNTAWTTTAYMEADFTCSGNTIAVANQLDMDPQSGQSAPYYRTVLTAGTDDTQVSAPIQFTFAGTGSGNQETILSCSATDSGNGEYRITPKLILTIPEPVKACSTYSATIVLTVY